METKVLATRPIKRKIQQESKRNNKRIAKLESEFVTKVLALDAKAEKFVSNLEDSVYTNLYLEYLAKFVLLIEKMELTGCYKCTEPDTGHFKERYNPVDGTFITKT